MCGRTPKRTAFDAVFSVVPTSLPPPLTLSRHQAPSLPPHPRYFEEPLHPFQKKYPTSHFCSLKAQTGSLRIIAASRILFMGRVCPLPIEDGSLPHLSTPDENALPRPQSYICPPLQPSLLRRLARKPRRPRNQNL